MTFQAKQAKRLDEPADSRGRQHAAHRAALRFGDLALTSTRFAGGATAEIARRQTDGSWLWVIDQPRVVG